jgi:hypothetical protein
LRRQEGKQVWRHRREASTTAIVKKVQLFLIYTTTLCVHSTSHPFKKFQELLMCSRSAYIFGCVLTISKVFGDIKTVDVDDGLLLFFSFGMDLSKRRVTGIWIF